MADASGRWNGFGVKLTEGDVNWAKVMNEVRKVYSNTWLTTEQGSGPALEDLKDLSSRFDKILQM